MKQINYTSISILSMEYFLFQFGSKTLKLRKHKNYENITINWLSTVYIYYSFTSKRLPLQPVSSERNHQVADKFRKVSCLNVYGRKRGRVGVKQCMHSFHFLDCLLSVFFDDYMSKLFPIFYLANFVCFYPSKYKAFPPNINYIFLILLYTK